MHLYIHIYNYSHSWLIENNKEPAKFDLNIYQSFTIRPQWLKTWHTMGNMFKRTPPIWPVEFIVPSCHPADLTPCFCVIPPKTHQRWPTVDPKRWVWWIFIKKPEKIKPNYPYYPYYPPPRSPPYIRLVRWGDTISNAQPALSTSFCTVPQTLLGLPEIHPWQATGLATAILVANDGPNYWVNICHNG